MNLQEAVAKLDEKQKPDLKGILMDIQKARGFILDAVRFQVFQDQTTVKDAKKIAAKLGKNIADLKSFL